MYVDVCCGLLLARKETEILLCDESKHRISKLIPNLYFCSQHLNKTYGSSVPLVLMNSFNTDEDTQKVVRKYQGFQVCGYFYSFYISKDFLMLRLSVSFMSILPSHELPIWG